MNKKLLIALALVSIMMLPAVAMAQAPQPPTWTNQNIIATLENIFDIAFNILMIVAAICLIIAGFFFVTAQGDPAKTKTARDFVLWALVGVAVAVLAKALIGGLASLLYGQ
jgi:heme/copper-type cytochrome/quinol oxidase subunit 2